MIIEVDLEKLDKHGLSPNDYIALFLKADNVDCNYPIDMSYMQKQGYIKITDEGFDLRKPALALLNRKIEADSVEMWIEDWRGLFPRMQINGYPVRGSKEGCLRKMKTFLKRNDFTKEEIYRATCEFIEAKRKVNFAFMTQAHYFIEKDGISLLASLCENVRMGDTQSTEDVFNRFV